MLWSLVLHTLIDLKYQPSRARLSFLCNNLAFAWTALETKKTNGRQDPCKGSARHLHVQILCALPRHATRLRRRRDRFNPLRGLFGVGETVRRQGRIEKSLQPLSRPGKLASPSNPIRCIYKLVVPNVHEKCTFSSVCILRNPG